MFVFENAKKAAPFKWTSFEACGQEQCFWQVYTWYSINNADRSWIGFRNSEPLSVEKLVLHELPTDCLREISLPPSKGTEPLIFHCCNIKTLLQHIVKCCPNFACQLLGAIDKAPAHRFDLIAYHDECTAGNVLQHGTAKKCSLLYFAVKWPEGTWGFCIMKRCGALCV